MTTTRCVISQKIVYLIYFAAESLKSRKILSAYLPVEEEEEEERSERHFYIVGGGKKNNTSLGF
jgi:hypothetical protein